MKRNKAKQILTDSFLELAEKKDIDKITIKDITDNCGYSPATFYRQFKDKYDLIGWEYSRTVEQNMTGYGTARPSWRSILLDGVHYFEERRGYLENLFLHTNGINSFITNMTEIHMAAVRSRILSAMDTDALSEKLEMYLRVYCSGCVNLACDWVLGKYPVPAEVLAEVFDYALPEPLRPYVTK